VRAILCPHDALRIMFMMDDPAVTQMKMPLRVSSVVDTRHEIRPSLLILGSPSSNNQIIGSEITGRKNSEAMRAAMRTWWISLSYKPV